jgi:hypothetical protein
MRGLLALTVISVGCRNADPPPKDLPPIAIALNKAAGSINDTTDRSPAIWELLRGKDAARDLLANNATGLLWLSGRGFSTYRVGTWGGLLQWTFHDRDAAALFEIQPGALVRCGATECFADDLEAAWEDVNLEASCGPFHRVFGVERDGHRYAVITGLVQGGDTHSLGIRVLHGASDAKAFAFTPKVIADDSLPELGAVKSKRGCSWVKWRGNYDTVVPDSDGSAFLLRTPRKVIRLEFDADHRLSTDSPARPAPPAQPTEPAQLLRPLDADHVDVAAGTSVVNELNELCGDTFCEGSYDWIFKSLACRAGQCTLAFTATSAATERVFDDKIQFPFRGRIGDADGLTEKFTIAVGRALAAWERKH